ncbi:MAG: PIN domain-containing protein [Planctomycetes bacterium]|nr:PIN domain-containing protein [Planctomycetota bacterium]
MRDRCFFDTNILVYAFDAGDPARQKTASALLQEGLATSTATLSFQVLHEFFVVVTRKIPVPLPPASARSVVADLLRHRVVEPSGAQLLAAIDLSRTGRTSFWDALIVMAAASAGCSTLYTEDLNHGEVYAGVRAVNPFRAP